MFVRSLANLPSFIAGDGSELRELMNPARDADVRGARYSLAHAMLPPGAVTKRHKLTASEVYYILSGRGLMHIDDDEREVGTGDAIYVPPDSVQFIENKGEVDLEFLCIVDPAWVPGCETILE